MGIEAILTTPLRERQSMTKRITLNAEQELYIIPCGNGYSCLGFDVLETRYTRLASELVSLGLLDCPMPAIRGSLERYAQYQAILDIACEHNRKTGWRSKSELTPELIGFEGKRVEVVKRWPSGNEKTIRFIVGKSTGFIPCHLQIMRRNSTGGCAVYCDNIISVRSIEGGAR